MCMLTCNCICVISKKVTFKLNFKKIIYTIAKPFQNYKIFILLYVYDAIKLMNVNNKEALKSIYFNILYNFNRYPLHQKRVSFNF